jgi:hypothetical protein
LLTAFVNLLPALGLILASWLPQNWQLMLATLPIAPHDPHFIVSSPSLQISFQIFVIKSIANALLAAKKKN